MAVEYELKFQADPARLAAIAQAFPVPAQTIVMETTYYDTPDGALSARRYTLRRRMENGCSVCTLKTPAKGLSRGEYQVECDSMAEALPILCKLSGVELLGDLKAETLLPVCGARFTREARLISLPDCTVELALDQGVLTGGSREIPLCEVEVELKEGTPQGALAFGIALAKRFALEQEKKSKFRRGLSLAKGDEYGTTG